MKRTGERKFFTLENFLLMRYNTLIMKSTIKRKTYQAIYRLLDHVSPLPADCGLLCSSACCTCGGDSAADDGADFDMGIYLLPGEEKLFTRKEPWLKWNVEDADDFEFPDSWHGKVYFIRCKTPPKCPREMRPLQCRFFPLAPYLTEDNDFKLILSPVELPYTCPLIKERRPLEQKFIRATLTVWKRLIQDPLIWDLVEMDSKALRNQGIYPETIG